MLMNNKLELSTTKCFFCFLFLHVYIEKNRFCIICFEQKRNTLISYEKRKDVIYNNGIYFKNRYKSR